MSSTARTGSSDDDSTIDAGSSTDQHITGYPETGTFTTEEAPTADTPIHGSSNAGLNKAANRDDAPQFREPDDAPPSDGEPPLDAAPPGG